MARPEQRTARKDYPRHGIKKGDRYWYVSLKTGPKSSRELRQIAPFNRAQLTTSEFLITMYGLEDRLNTLTNLDDLDDIKTELETLRDETQEKFNNMPEGLQQGATGEQLTSRINGCDAAINEIEELIGRYEELGLEKNADGEIVRTEDSQDEDGDDDASEDNRAERYNDLVEEAKAISIDYE